MGIFSDLAIERLISGGTDGLLDRAMKLFYLQLKFQDPDFISRLGLHRCTPELLVRRYFEDRARRRTPEAIKYNLAEAMRNHQAQRTVMWRYVFIRAHEAFAKITPFLDRSDLKRFHQTLKPVFADSYGCVPHRSIAKILALIECKNLQVIALGRRGIRYSKGTFWVAGDKSLRFETLIDARGQRSFTLAELGFTKLAQSLGPSDPFQLSPVAENANAFLLNFETPRHGDFYCCSLPVILNRHPFAQGLVTSHAVGKSVAEDIVASMQQRDRRAA